MRKLLLTLTLAAFLLAPDATGAPDRKANRCPDVKAGITFYRAATWDAQDALQIRRTRASGLPVIGCRYAGWVADMWRNRAKAASKLASWKVLPATSDWQTAVRVAQRVYPGTSDWLLYISRREGGHGGFVMNHQGSGAGGWMQFMSSTFYAYVDAALADTRSRGFVVPDGSRSWYSPMGQALTAGYMRFTGRDGCHWCLG